MTKSTNIQFNFNVLFYFNLSKISLLVSFVTIMDKYLKRKSNLQYSNRENNDNVKSRIMKINFDEF